MNEFSPVKTISAYQQGSVGHIIIQRPESKNAISQEMWEAFPQIIAALNDLGEIRSIVISGQGDESFSAGADISEFAIVRANIKTAAHYEDLNVKAFQAIANSPKPTIAKIAGICMGGGLALALACDIRIAADNAVFALPPAKLGLAYPIEGIRQLLAAVAPSIAKEMIFTAKRLNVLEASRNGLVNQVTTIDQLDETVADLCNTIAQNAPLTISASKQMIDELHNNPENPDLTKLQNWSDVCFNSDDYTEGQKAFLEKRKPVFKGK